MTSIGSAIDKKYEILKKIGQGGMSVVYLAMDKRLNKQWAIKEIKKEGSGRNNEIIVQSLLAEAKLMKKLDHPSLPRIVDIIDNGETIYVVMDYIEGEPLDRIVNEYGSQPQERVIDWAKQLCDVLQYLHSQKPPIIYRDMKPANVMLKPEGNLKVIDFGIAREYKEENLADTVSLGTKGYAAPEQFGGKGQTDARTDIYCLGVTLYHLITGQNPSEPPYELYPIRQWNPNLSGGLERIIEKCTQLNPEDRYQSCAELLYDLEHYEKVDGEYKKKLKDKLKVFIISSSLCLLMLTTGFTGKFLAAREKNNNYLNKINISASTDYETKINTYKEAITLIGSDPRAYHMLLEAYKANNTFGDKESNEFTALYNANKSSFVSSEIDNLNIKYDIGTTYFYLYSGGDNSFRSRILKAYPYFAEIYEADNQNFKYNSMAESYYIIGNFYSQYVVNPTSVKEPAEEAYESLLESLLICIDNVEEYTYDDAAYIKLIMYQEIMNLLNDHRRGFALTGVEKAKVEGILTKAQEESKSLFVTQSTSVNIQANINRIYPGYIEALNRSYINAKERR
ncbi:serine/threonine protein kinase [Clostridium polynesiense]|uniref:serine/threonine protein kinase n=1 Tax=Clostridium polynesiense TaxID=1325933 RepID=UPI00058EB608|nr:serine/threonine-protein kinase [Clostridium polynesiense]